MILVLPELFARLMDFLSHRWAGTKHANRFLRGVIEFLYLE
jgi:hypothetical protein